ncbi:protein peste-like isoform X1 [Diorhabda carinulata]|uniref:protein peste-like isoform X1 n=2 Tax=Diorhabda carinulata TaxID=1163345 RepID=UPI0025A1A98E|nr:protein peste-like isoform X1 [Diorhabda carinulata]
MMPRGPVMQKTHCGKICLLFSGILVVCFGSCILIFFESIYDSILNYGLQFNPSSQAYQGWYKSPPIPTYFYLFNWTNPEKINDVSVKPEFEENGPYRFYEIRGKSNVSWFDHYVKYKSYTSTFFDETKKNGNLSDVINSVNTVALAVGYQARFQNFWTKKMMSLGLSSKSVKLYVTKPVRELLFDGYEDPVLGLLSKLPFFGAPDKGGFFYGRNGTVGLDGTYNMHFKNDDRFGEVLLWNNKNQTDFFNGECNSIKGSSGEFFPLNRKKDRIMIFSSEMCKSLVLYYTEEVMIKGVLGYKYSAEYGFDNGTVYPENYCYCNGECIPTGVFNVSSCRMNSPTFLSFPHFFNADPVYRDSVKGMKPNRTLHEFYMILEPKSGIVMELQGGIQLNMLLQPVSSIRLYNKVPRIFLPIFYIVHKVELSDEIAAGLRLIQNLPTYSYYMSYTLISTGLICIFGVIVLLFCRYKASNLTKMKINREIIPVKKIIIYEQVPLKEKSDITWT